jgi:CubicO group peptidase (beta-lactamase class C family)
MSVMRTIDRRKLLVGMGAALAAPSVTTAAAASELRKIAPADAGFAADLDERLDRLITSGRAWKLHGVAILRKGALVLERYDAGEDEVWGRPIGRVAFAPETLHDLRSVTKSILGLLYGIALAQGKVPAPDRPLLEAFPDYADLATDPRHKRLTIAHALTMSLGFEWNEDIPYQDPTNSEIQMERAPDRYRYILSRPFVAEPGARWIYGAAATALIGKLIQNGTGQSLPDFARANLFDPIGVGETAWSNGFNGEPSASSGLRMTPRDLARVGQLILNRGQWEGRQVVPVEWLDKSFQPYVACDEFRRYGYFWYVGDLQYGNPPYRPIAHWIGAFGYGGQRLFVLPELDLVVAITAGNYADANQWIPPIRVMREVVLASIS